MEKADTALLADAVDFVAEIQFLLRVPPQDDGGVIGGKRGAFQKGAQGCDADPGPDHHYFVPSTCFGAEHAVRSLHHHLGAGPQPGQPGRTPAQVPDGDSEPALAVGSPHQRLGGKAERMGMPPQARGEEPPDKEPAAGPGQLFEPTARHFDADHAGGNPFHPADRQAVPGGGNQGLQHPEVEQGPARCRAHGEPVPALPGSFREQSAHAELVGERSADRGIRQQVHRVPEFVGKTAPHRHQRGNDDGEEKGH